MICFGGKTAQHAALQRAVDNRIFLAVLPYQAQDYSAVSVHICNASLWMRGLSGG